MQYSFSADNLPVSDSITADAVRAVTPNDHGRSYVIYTEELNKDGQADGTIQYIQYAYGYLNQSQITAICVSTEQELTDNVAQAFLYSQDVTAVYAWDGSVTPLSNGFARLSNNQIHFYSWMKEVESERVIEPLRNNYSGNWLWRMAVSHDYDEINNDPIGKVAYFDLPFSYICRYHYYEKLSDGSIVSHVVKIDLLTGEMEVE